MNLKLDLKQKLIDKTKSFRLLLWSEIEKQIKIYRSGDLSDSRSADELTEILVNRLKITNRFELPIGKIASTVLKEYELFAFYGGTHAASDKQLTKFLNEFEFLIENGKDKFDSKEDLFEILLTHGFLVNNKLEAIKNNSLDADDSNMVFRLLQDDLRINPDELSHLKLINDVLKQKFNIDINGGENLDKIPRSVVSTAICWMRKTLDNYPDIDSTEAESIPETERENIDYMQKLINGYFQSVVAEHSGEPQKILVEEPLFMEWFNLRPNVNVLPPKVEISEEESIFLEECTKKYQKKLMPREVFKKYFNIYSKLLFNKIKDYNLEEYNLLKYSETIIGQFILDNPIFDKDDPDFISMDVDSIIKIVLQDYGKDITRENAFGEEYKISMLTDNENPSSTSSIDAAHNTIYLSNSNKGSDFIKKMLEGIDSIYRESEHAKIEEEGKRGICSDPVHYAALKTMQMRKHIPHLIIDGAFNHERAPGEIEARIHRDDEVNTFLERHGVTDSKIIQDYKRKYAKDLKLDKKFGTMVSPRVYDVLLCAQNGIKKAARYVMSSKMFKSKDQREEEPKSGDEIKMPDILETQDTNNGEFKVSLKHGFEFRINSLFDEYVKEHPELCKPGSLFSMEYNPDGEKKSLSQLIEEMSFLGVSPEDDDKRAVYKYIIESCIKETEKPSQVFEVLYNYKSTNPETDKIVQSVVQETIYDTVLSMHGEFIGENIDELRSRYAESGLCMPQFTSEGKSYSEKVNAIIDKIHERYQDEKAQKEVGERETYSPFIKGVLSLVPENDNRFLNAAGYSQLRRLNVYKMTHSPEFLIGRPLETAASYIISVSDVARALGKQAIEKVGGMIKEKLQSPNESEGGEAEIDEEEEGFR